jgi:uncharacterized membrane protein (DUF485 family)
VGAGSAGSRPPGSPVDWTAIEDSPEFRRLVAARRRLVTALMGATTLTFAVYLALIILGGDGFLGDAVIGSFTWGMLLVVAMTVLTFVLTAIYGRVSNRELDPLAERVRASERREREQRFG